MTEEEMRQVELEKYEHCYNKDQTYRMGRERRLSAEKALQEIPFRDSYLDVGCGRGEMLVYANNVLGFKHVRGTETVNGLLEVGIVDYATVNALPYKDNSFDVVSMFDVIEHLNEFDLKPACQELERVARKAVVITASNLPSVEKGMDLHISKKPYPEWDRLFHEWFTGEVFWRNDLKNHVSEMWMVKCG